MCRFYLVADSEANCFALSVYALRDGAVSFPCIPYPCVMLTPIERLHGPPYWCALIPPQIKEGATITLLEPFFHEVNVTWQDKVNSSSVLL